MIHILTDMMVINPVDSWLFTYVWPFIPAIIGGTIAGVIARWLIIRLFEKKEFDDMMTLKRLGIADIRIETNGTISMLHGGEVIKNVKNPKRI